jgi:hypothetical protein
MMTNAMTVYENFDNLQRAAIALQQSGYFPDARDKAKAITKVMAGAELGLPPFASMSGIHIIQGKPTLGSNVIATLVKNDPRYDYRIVKSDNDACILDWFEDGERVGQAGFTYKEAQGAGLTSKDNWKKYTSDMLFARAISRGARRFAPGIFGGSPVYTPDEMGADTDEDGYIDAESITIEEPDPVDDAIEDAGPAIVDEPMTIEKACAVQNSEGVAYGDLDSEKLSMMTIGINKALGKDDLTDEKREYYLMKKDAIETILKARDDGSILAS